MSKECNLSEILQASYINGDSVLLTETALREANLSRNVRKGLKEGCIYFCLTKSFNGTSLLVGFFYDADYKSFAVRCGESSFAFDNHNMNFKVN